MDTTPNTEKIIDRKCEHPCQVAGSITRNLSKLSYAHFPYTYDLISFIKKICADKLQGDQMIEKPKQKKNCLFL
jgi:hypothetical protein